jgi:hypothetical protein
VGINYYSFWLAFGWQEQEERTGNGTTTDEGEDYDVAGDVAEEGGGDYVPEGEEPEVERPISGPCIAFNDPGVLCVPWFSIDYWQEVLDYKDVFRGEPYET